MAMELAEILNGQGAPAAPVDDGASADTPADASASAPAEPTEAKQGEKPTGEVKQAAKVEPAKPEKSAPPADPAKESKPPPDYVPRAALHEERRKRQELEGRLKALEEAKANPPEPPVGLLDDPDKWEQQLRARVEAEVQKVRHESQANILGFLETQSRAAHPDFDDVIAVFAEQARANPALAQEALQQPNPVEYAYSAGRRLRMLTEAGDLDKLIERERAAARAEALAELKAEQEKAEADTPSEPKTAADGPESLTEIASARNNGATRKWSGPKPLSELLPSH